MQTRDKSPEELKAQWLDAEQMDTRVTPLRWEDTVSHDALHLYIDILRSNRRQREEFFTGPVRRFIDAIPLNPGAEAKIIEKLRTTVISTDNTSEHSRMIEGAFPSGTMLFHGAKTSNMVNILKSGYLVNARALDENLRRSGNGGEEGISWSIDDIEALPGTRFHMAGFLAAPETVLGSRYQLAVPDNPAPYEVVQLSKDIDADEFYESYTQARLLEYVYNAVATLSEAGGSELGTSASADKQRQYYQVGESGEIVLDRRLGEAIFHHGEEFAVELWHDALSHLPGGEQVASNLESILDDLEKRILAYGDKINEDVNAKNDVRLPIESLFMVVADKDVDVWLRVLARCPARPRAIVAYRSDAVRLEDFVSTHQGDGHALAEELQSIVPRSKDTILFQDVLGVPFDDGMRDKAKPHVIAPEYLGNTKRIISNNGRIQVV